MNEQIEKQAIEEMAHIVSNSIMTWANELPPISNPHFVATAIYNAGYRKQREGEWVKRTWIIFDSEKVGFTCSECNTTWDTETKFCPNCGAKMKGGAEEATRNHFSPEDVRKMPSREVRENFTAIMESMKEWK